jgi:hypothetical protein
VIKVNELSVVLMPDAAAAVTVESAEHNSCILNA